VSFSVEQIFGVVGGAIVALIGFIFKNFSGRLDSVEKKQADHELHVIQNYVQDADFKEALKPLFHKLDRMETKLDDANYKLANKADRA